MQTDRRQHAIAGTAVALLALLALLAADVAAQAPFFGGPPMAPLEPMFFSIYSALPEQNGNANLARVAAGKFSAAGPYYNDDGNPRGDGAAFFERVDQVGDNGLKFVAHLSRHPGIVDDVVDEIRPQSMGAITEADLRAHVRTVADYTLQSPAANATVAAWFVMPEELRPWKPQEMDYLRIVADELHAYDPLERPVTMYNPNHRTSEELAAIVGQGLDWTLMGIYATAVDFDERGARIADGVARILDAAEATETVPVAAFQLSQDLPPDDLQALQNTIGETSSAAAIRHVLRHDVYQGLVRGVRGVQLWSGCDCRPGLTTFAEQLAGYASVSHDLNGELGLANVFLKGERRDDIGVVIRLGPKTITHQSTTIDALTMADIAYGDDRYLFIVNSSASNVLAQVTGLPPGETELAVLFPDQTTPALNPSTGSFLLPLRALDVVGFRISETVDAELNDVGRVDGADLLRWQRFVGKSTDDGPAVGDFNYDGRVDRDDLAAWRSLFSQRTSGAAQIPEPLTHRLVAWLLAIRTFWPRKPLACAD